MTQPCALGPGFGLIAICYGFARFAFGLFLPLAIGQTVGASLFGLMMDGLGANHAVAAFAAVALVAGGERVQRSGHP